jgi:nicotinamidase-related amidase
MVATSARNGTVTLSEKALLTPDNRVLALIDYQPQMPFGAATFDRQDVINKTVALAKTAQISDVPTAFY